MISLFYHHAIAQSRLLTTRQINERLLLDYGRLAQYLVRLSFSDPLSTPTTILTVIFLVFTKSASPPCFPRTYVHTS
jgi:hypothetical protein